MITKYKYKEKVCSTLYELSEILGKDGVFIPLSIGDEALAEKLMQLDNEIKPKAKNKFEKIY